MIHVDMPQMPHAFRDRVEIPGYNFLASCPNPSSKDWTNHNYWTRITSELYQSLGGICMYCASFTPRYSAGRCGEVSIDHAIPKSQGNHYQAYEWNNFRLARVRLNNLKGDRILADPCVINDGWFQINFNSFYIIANPCLSVENMDLVNLTIDVLRLNADSKYVDERVDATLKYVKKEFDFDSLTKFYPFIAKEMIRQDFDNNYLPSFLSCSEEQNE